MNKISNILLSVALISGSPAIAGKSHIDKQFQETLSKIDRICAQPFGGENIPISCENIRSILKQNPGFTADAKDKLPNGETRHVIRNKDGHIILYVLSTSDKKE